MHERFFSKSFEWQKYKLFQTVKFKRQTKYVRSQVLSLGKSLESTNEN